MLHYEIKKDAVDLHSTVNSQLGSNKLSTDTDATGALLTPSLTSKSRSSNSGFITDNSALSSSSSEWTKLKFPSYS